MTGELTLTGQILAVGGIREKVIAARRRKINQLILPEACRRDYDELPDYLKANINVHFAAHFREVFEFIFQVEYGDLALCVYYSVNILVIDHNQK